MLFFTVYIQTKTAIFIAANLIATTAANICSVFPTYFESGLCQELGIYQAILCLYFPLFLSWGTMRKNVSYVTRIFYRLSCLVSLCPSFSPPVVNHLLCKIVLEPCRVTAIPPLKIIPKRVGISIIHSKYLSINSDTPILGLNLPLKL